MSLTAAGLKAVMHSEINARKNGAGQIETQDALLDALATAIVNYFKANAVVNTTISVGAIATGVTAGAAAVPVTGATIGTIT